MSEDNNINAPDRFSESDIKGEKIIFDTVIKDKLAHVIVIKDDERYHVNLDGEDLGYFTKDSNGNIERHPQPKGAHLDLENYFKPIEAKLEEMNM